MRNIHVIESFLNQDERVDIKTKNLKRRGQILVNYNTVIARYLYDKHLIINDKKYSRSTSTIQNKIMQLADERGIPYYRADGECELIEHTFILPQ